MKDNVRDRELEDLIQIAAKMYEFRKFCQGFGLDTTDDYPFGRMYNEMEDVLHKKIEDVIKKDYGIQVDETKFEEILYRKCLFNLTSNNYNEIIERLYEYLI